MAEQRKSIKKSSKGTENPLVEKFGSPKINKSEGPRPTTKTKKDRSNETQSEGPRPTTKTKKDRSNETESEGASEDAEEENEDDRSENESGGASEDAEEENEDDRSPENESGSAKIASGETEDVSERIRRHMLSFDELEWDEDDFQTEMECLPVVEAGPRVFEILKSTLSFWLSSSQNEVYLVSPFLDQVILKEFLDIVLKKKETANIGFLLVREYCNYGNTFQVIWDRTMDEYECKEDKTFLTQTVFSKASGIKKTRSYFHAKFVGCVKTENREAEVLLTSANFTTESLKQYPGGIHSWNHESLAYHKMKKAIFRKRFIQPMISILKENNFEK